MLMEREFPVTTNSWVSHSTGSAMCVQVEAELHKPPLVNPLGAWREEGNATGSKFLKALQSSQALVILSFLGL